MSDVGGLQGILYVFCMGILVLLNHNNFDNYLASRLYKIKNNTNTDSQSYAKNATLSIKPTKWCNTCEFILDAIPNCLKCKRCKFRKTRKMESIE